MVVRSESREQVASAVEEVYGYLADVERWPEWASGIVECRVGGGTPLEVGARLEQRVKRMLGGTGGRRLDVTAVEPPRRLGFAGLMGPSPLRWGFELSPAGAGETAVLLWVEAEPRGVMRVMPGGLLRRMFRRVNARELLAIRSAVVPRKGPAQAMP